MIKLKKSLLTILFLLATVLLKAQPTGMIYEISPEIKMNFEKSPLEIRFRPGDHILGDNLSDGRTDFMVGAKTKYFTLLSYSKIGYTQANYWTGVRLDFNLSLLKNKLLFNIQERYFWGLNQKSEDHYYLIQYIRYAVFKKVHLGVLGYGKWRIEKDFNKGNSFMGPTFEVFFPYNFGFQYAIVKDVLADNLYMSFFRINYKILIKNKSIQE